MNDDQLLRYSRHILLDEIGIEGQNRLLKARALIVGAGGLGSPVALYLASAGLGHLTLADADDVDLTNLQRQIMHNQTRIGQNKANSGKAALAEINPEIGITALPERLSGARLQDEVSRADVVLDCSDNFATRYAINLACAASRTPLVSGAAIRFSGQLSVYDFRRPETPCYHCLFPEGEDVDETRCAVMGVFAPLTRIVGSMQAAEALKLISGAGAPSSGRLLLFDALRLGWREVKFSKDPQCVVCGQNVSPCANRQTHAQPLAAPAHCTARR